MEDNTKKLSSLTPVFEPVKGDFGIEVEMERTGSHDEEEWDTISDCWGVEEDPSLKKNGVELVLVKPVKLAKTEKLLKDLVENLSGMDSEFLPSIRAGVHIHLNMQERNLGQLKRFMATYFLLESAMTRSCGDSREGNLFCLRLRDAEYAAIKYTEMFCGGPVSNLCTNRLRYAAFNLQPLFKFGTVEFRAMNTPKDLMKILPWCQAIYSLRAYSETFDSTDEILQTYRELGVREFFKQATSEEFYNTVAHDGMEVDAAEDFKACQLLFCIGDGNVHQ